MKPLSERIRDKILDDVTDRRGWRQEWDQFDEDIQNEIKATWLKKIEKELKRAIPPASADKAQELQYCKVCGAWPCVCKPAVAQEMPREFKCGHGKEWHSYSVNTQTLKCFNESCDCLEFRPSTPADSGKESK